MLRMTNPFVGSIFFFEKFSVLHDAMYSVAGQKERTGRYKPHNTKSFLTN
jgi:hypothetical protein